MDTMIVSLKFYLSSTNDLLTLMVLLLKFYPDSLTFGCSFSKNYLPFFFYSFPFLNFLLTFV